MFRIGKTAAERQRERRQHLRADPDLWAAYLKADAERKREKYKNASAQELKQLRKTSRNSSANFRSKSRAQEDAGQDSCCEPMSVYGNMGCFQKAKNKVTQALPKSPRKAKAIIGYLAEKRLNATIFQANSTHQNAISLEIVNEVLDFYYKDDVSRVMPGKGDTVIVRDKGRKEIKQKRHLVMTVGETYEAFKAENPDLVIGKSKFAQLRPSDVLLVSLLPHNVCGCKYHSNVILLLECLNRKMPTTFSTYSKTQFIPKCVCNLENENCMSNDCDQCKDGALFRQNFMNVLPQEQLNEDLSWYQWENEDKYITKVRKNGTMEEAIQDLESQLPKFTWHVFIKDKQSKSYENDKRDAQKEDSQNVCVQFDFSENAQAIFQDEIQSAYYHKTQITLFTIVIWHKGTTVSWIIVSDCTSHDKRAVTAFLANILSFIAGTFPQSKTISIWSDGPASQFKSKFMFATFAHLSTQFQQSLWWNFFATSHGKGPCDGLGGTAKRIVQRTVLGKKILVKSAKDFLDVLEKNSSIRLTEVTEKDIDDKCKELNTEALWKDVPPIPGTSNTHCLHPIDDSHVEIKFYTSATESKVHSVKRDVARVEVIAEVEPVSDVVPGQPIPLEMPEQPVPTDVPAQPIPIEVSTETELITVERSPEPGPSRQRGKQKTKKRAAKKRQKQKDNYPCRACNWSYGEKADPKKDEEWVPCQMCKVYMHLSCCEDFGVFEDDNSFTCVNCIA